MTAKFNTKKLVILLVLVSGFMLSLAYISVPIYNLFCSVTGYGGTTKRYSENVTQELGSKTVQVSFSASTSRNLPLKFSTDQQTIPVKTGENVLMFYKAENTSDDVIDVMAIYNITPHKAGKYFNKVACFCFSKQTLEPKVEFVMPVSFFIDSDIENDPEMSDVSSITLSYTFFEYRE